MSKYQNILPLVKSNWIHIVIVILANVFFLFIPLLNVFGFEFSLANSIPFVFISGIFTIRFFAKTKKENLTSYFVSSGKLFALLLIIPFLISVVHSLFTMFCSFGDGLLFYLIITIPAFIVGSSLGLLIFYLVKRIRIITFIALVVIIISFSLIEFYFNPQVYFLNPVYGYFPGTIYDEGISVSLKLISYRLLNILFFGGIFFLLFNQLIGRKRINRIFILSLVIISSCIFVYFKPTLGYSTTQNRLSSTLSEKVVTEHFTIYFSPKVPDKLLQKITLEHEYYYNSLKRFFRAFPDSKLTSFVFKSSIEKGNLFGSANADVAKPWLNQIYVSADSYEQTLKHELAHVFTGNFGTGFFKVAAGINPALIEGAAVAADPFYSETNIDYMAALAYKNKYKINLKELFGGLSFFSKVSSLSYIYSGSFSKYLVDKFGIEKFKQFYSNGNLFKAYKISPDSIYGKYFSYLETVKTGNENEANYYYGRQTIFQKICPRYVADRLKEGWDDYSSGKFKKSKEVFSEILTKTTNYSAIVGLSSTYYKLNEQTKALKVISSQINNFKNSAYFFNLELRLADQLVLIDSLRKADSIYTELTTGKSNRNLVRIALLRKKLIKKSILSDYLTGSDSVKYKILKNLNLKNYDFNSLPFLTVLASNLNINYSEFILQLDKNLLLNADQERNYAFLKISEYMLDNNDFENSRKMAALAIRVNKDESIKEYLKANFDKADWFYYNADEILKNLKKSD